MNRTDLDSLSLRMIAEQSPAYLIMISLCPFILATNLFVIITICGTKSLRTKSLWLVCSLSIVDILMSLILFSTYLRRVILYFMRIPETTTQYFCFWTQALVNFSADIEQAMIFALAVDRFLCIRFPLFYKTVRTLPYVLTYNAASLGFEALMALYAYLTLDRNLIVPACDRTTSFDQKFLSLQNVKGLVFLALTIVIYVILGVIMYRRYKSAKTNADTQKSNLRRQLDFDVFFATVLIGGISIVVYGTFVLAIVFDSKAEAVSISMIVAAISISAHSMSYFFVYLKVNKQFRKAFFIVVCRRKNGQTKVLVIRSSGVGGSSVSKREER